MKPTETPELDRRLRLEVAAPQIAGARLADVRAFEDPITEERAPDLVHDMRVASRRLRASLALLYGKQVDGAGVKALADALGAVRDRHVQGAWLAEVAPSLASAITRELPSVERALLVALHEWTARAVPRLVLGLSRVRPRGRLFGARIRRRLRRELRAISDQLDALDPATLPAAPTHALRIALKKLRYQLEVVAPVSGKKLARVLDQLAPLQDALGELHDADVRLALLARLKAPPALRREVSDGRRVYALALGAELVRWREERTLDKLGQRVMKR